MAWVQVMIHWLQRLPSHTELVACQNAQMFSNCFGCPDLNGRSPYFNCRGKAKYCKTGMAKLLPLPFLLLVKSKMSQVSAMFGERYKSSEELKKKKNMAPEPQDVNHRVQASAQTTAHFFQTTFSQPTSHCERILH